MLHGYLVGIYRWKAVVVFQGLFVDLKGLMGTVLTWKELSIQSLAPAKYPMSGSTFSTVLCHPLQRHDGFHLAIVSGTEILLNYVLAPSHSFYWLSTTLSDSLRHLLHRNEELPRRSRLP